MQGLRILTKQQKAYAGTWMFPCRQDNLCKHSCSDDQRVGRRHIPTYAAHMPGEDACVNMIFFHSSKSCSLVHSCCPKAASAQMKLSRYVPRKNTKCNTPPAMPWYLIAQCHTRKHTQVRQQEFLVGRVEMQSALVYTELPFSLRAASRRREYNPTAQQNTVRYTCEVEARRAIRPPFRCANMLMSHPDIPWFATSPLSACRLLGGSSGTRQTPSISRCPADGLAGTGCTPGYAATPRPAAQHSPI
jgi:hypothetical protein